MSENFHRTSDGMSEDEFYADPRAKGMADRIQNVLAGLAEFVEAAAGQTTQKNAEIAELTGHVGVLKSCNDELLKQLNATDAHRETLRIDLRRARKELEQMKAGNAASARHGRKRLRTGSADNDEDEYEMEGDHEKAPDANDDVGSGKNACAWPARLRLQYDAPPTCFAIKYTSRRDAPP